VQEINVFGTKIWTTHIVFDLSTIDLIYKTKGIVPTKKRSNQGGYQTPFCDEHTHPWMKDTLDLVQTAASKPGHVTYWFNVNGPGHYNAFHDHGDFGTKMCGCLYLQVPPDSGAIRFQQIRGRQTLDVQPEAGMLILFPDNIRHSVLKNNSDSDRVSIAFNFWRMIR